MAPNPNLAIQPPAVSRGRTLMRPDSVYLGEKSDLQLKYNAVMRRVTGRNARHNHNHSHELEDQPAPKVPKRNPKRKSVYSISTPSSYTSLASLNPYSLDAEDLAARLSEIDTHDRAPSALSSPEDEDGDEGGEGEGEEDVAAADSLATQAQNSFYAQTMQRLAQDFDAAHRAILAEESAALRVLMDAARGE